MTAFAFVFPGQGAQSVGMLSAWGEHPVIRATLEEAGDALGQDVASLIANGPKEALDATTNTQPVMLTASIACYRVWIAETGLAPAVVAGHSLGEYSALVAAGALAFGEALPLVRFRAQAMQEAVPAGAGAMAAILGLDATVVRDVCGHTAVQSGEVVEAVNFNDPSQVVIAGTKAGVERACEALRAQGAKRAVLLAVSAPFHSSLMKPAADQLKVRLESTAIMSPRLPVIHNVDASYWETPSGIRDALFRQAAGPVRWSETVLEIKARGVSHVIECGPGKVLTGLTRRIDSTLKAAALFDPGSLMQVKELLMGAVA